MDEKENAEFTLSRLYVYVLCIYVCFDGVVQYEATLRLTIDNSL